MVFRMMNGKTIYATVLKWFLCKHYSFQKKYTHTHKHAFIMKIEGRREDKHESRAKQSNAMRNKAKRSTKNVYAC